MTIGRIPSVEGGIQPTIFDAKADILTATAADTPARLAVGANGTVLKANSATATGLEWGSASATKSYSLVNAGGTALTGAATVTVSGLSGYDDYLIFIAGASSTTASAVLFVRFNGDTANNYSFGGWRSEYTTTYSTNNYGEIGNLTRVGVQLAQMSTNAGSTGSGSVRLYGANSAGVKPYIATGGFAASSGNGQIHSTFGGIWNNSATVSSISVFVDAGTLDAGTLYIYGAA